MVWQTRNSRPFKILRTVSVFSAFYLSMMILSGSAATSVLAEEMIGVKPFPVGKATHTVGHWPLPAIALAAATNEPVGGLRIAGEQIHLSQPATQQQLECAARAAWGEARGTSVRGMEAIVCTTFRRTAGRRAERPRVLPCDVVLEDLQYQGIDDVVRQELKAAARRVKKTNKGAPFISKTDDSLSEKDRRALDAARSRASAVFTGQETRDPTNGATSFVSTGLWNSSRRPKWTVNYRVTAIFDGHVFLAPLRQHDLSIARIE